MMGRHSLKQCMGLSKMNFALSEASNAASETRAEEAMNKDALLGVNDVYTPEMIGKRKLIRRNTEVKDWLYHWWQTAVRAIAGTGEVLVVDVTSITQEQYLRVMRKVSKAMLKDFDPGEATRSALDDWRNDVKGGATMRKQARLDSTERSTLSRPVPE